MQGNPVSAAVHASQRVMGSLIGPFDARVHKGQKGPACMLHIKVGSTECYLEFGTGPCPGSVLWVELNFCL
jgi:hypothetical protein